MYEEPVLWILIRVFEFPYFHEEAYLMAEHYYYDSINLSKEFISSWHFIIYQYSTSAKQVNIELVSPKLNQRYQKVITNLHLYSSD